MVDQFFFLITPICLYYFYSQRCLFAGNDDLVGMSSFLEGKELEPCRVQWKVHSQFSLQLSPASLVMVT